ncbi:MAG: hypothetical protein ACRDJN_22775, partial [Chloroflexota bacterium]
RRKLRERVPDFEAVRREFPGLEGWVSLNSAAGSCGSRRMAAALQRYAADKQRGGRDGRHRARVPRAGGRRATRHRR